MAMNWPPGYMPGPGSWQGGPWQQQPNWNWPPGYMPGAYPGGYPGGQGQQGAGFAAGDAGFFGMMNQPTMGQPSTFFEQQPLDRGGQPVHRFAQATRAALRAPRPNQVNPALWDALSPSGRQLALGLAEDTGYDATDYEQIINNTRPVGQAPRTATVGYGAPRGVGGRF